MTPGQGRVPTPIIGAIGGSHGGTWGVKRTARASLLGFVAAAVLFASACATAPSATERRVPSTVNLEVGVQALRAKEYDKAVQQLEIAIVADPKNADGYYRLGQSHRGRGDFRRALKYIALALQIRPNHLAALHAQGATELDAGER